MPHLHRLTPLWRHLPQHEPVILNSQLQSPSEPSITWWCWSNTLCFLFQECTGCLASQSIPLTWQYLATSPSRWTVRRRVGQSHGSPGSRTAAWWTRLRPTEWCCPPAPCSSWGSCTARRTPTVECTGASPLTSPAAWPAGTPHYKSQVIHTSCPL